MITFYNKLILNTKFSLTTCNTDVINSFSLLQGCPDECLATNLTHCYGASPSQCCNVYFNNSCAAQCPTNYSASLNSNFKCGKYIMSVIFTSF